MAGITKRLRRCGAAPLRCAVAALWAAPADASELDLFSADTIEVFGDVRVVAANGQESWVDRGFGKLRSGGTGDELRVRPQLGNVSLVWKPQFTWSLGATIVGSLQGGERTEAGLSEAYLTFRPMRGSKFAFSGRAGLMWPPVSLEHEAADWHVRDSITPSAINSWIGEEVRPVAAEGSVATHFGEHEVRATAAVMAANDTSGTLLTFRGWALHDRTTLAFRRQPLPPLEEEYQDYQAPFTHPLLDVGVGFARRPGYYAKIAWQAPIPVRFELFRYDNLADPEAVNEDVEWGWRTWFNHVGAVADLGGGMQLKLQALAGRTQMGMVEEDKRWFDARFRSAFAMVVRPFGPFGVAARIDLFDVRNHGSLWEDEYDDTGWSAMVAGKRDWGRFTALVELLHVSSERGDRHEVRRAPRQRQTQLQGELRIRW